MEEFGNAPCNEQQPCYVPYELVNCSSNTNCNITYHCYLIELKQDFNYKVSVHDIVLAMRTELDSEIATTQFDVCVERGNLAVNLRPVETIHLTPHEVQNCRRFQTTLFRILLDGNVNKSAGVSDEFCLGDNPEIDYLLLPANVNHQRSSNSIVDWKTISSVPFSPENSCECKDGADHGVWTKNGLVCSCKLENCVVSTPHNGFIYIVTGAMELNGNSYLHLGRKGATAITYKDYFEQKHGIQLHFEHQHLLKGRKHFKVNNYLLRCRLKKEKGSSTGSAELPPELCFIIMSPISISTIYSFSFIPSIMHRLESLLVAFNLKKMLYDHCTQNDIPIFKILQAITAKECQESHDYESLETLGDSFLKYAASQQLFKTNQNHNEGLLTEERKKIISNVALFNFGCKRRLPGFIRKGTFDPKSWIIPGDQSKSLLLKEEIVSSRTIVYVVGRRELTCKVVADVVEALIGAFVSTGAEDAALSFMNWLGIKVDFNIIPYERHLSIHPEKLLKNVSFLESLLNYSFHDLSLLVEALTHGSYQRHIPISYQRLEFLGDAVLDYLITMHFYNEYPDMSSEFFTDMRSISVNNECYALSSIRAKLHEHILRDSKELDRQFEATVNEVEKLSLKLESTFGWELETSFSEVLADVIESLAGAIFVDSGYKKEVVFQSIRPLLEPLVAPDTAKLHPSRELKELCQRQHYKMKETLVSHDLGVASVTIEVEANGITYKHTATASNKPTALKVASKEVLKPLKPMLNS